MAEILKWWETIQYQWAKSMAYRLNFFLEITGPILVFFFVQYNLWNSIYGNDPTLMIKGYKIGNAFLLWLDNDCWHAITRTHEW